MNYELRVAVDNQIFQRQSYGGISRYFVELVHHFSEINDVSIEIFAPFHRNSYLENSFDPLTFRLQLFDYTNRFGVGSAIDRFSNLVSGYQIVKFKPQIIHETFYNGPVDFLRHIPRVITVYDMIREMENPTSEKAKRKFASIMAASSIITISDSTREDLLSLIPVDPGNVKTIHLAASDFFSPINTSSIESLKPYVLYVGQRSGYKNFVNFCRAFSHSSNLRNELNIHVFGGGKFNKSELQVLDELNLLENVIKIDGDDIQLRIQYSNARALIYPSIMEGFGIPLVEAMKSGCPVICSDRSSIPEVAGEAAIYFDPTSTDSMRSIMESTLGNSEMLSTMQGRGLFRSQNFSWKKTAEETNLLYGDTVRRVS